MKVSDERPMIMDEVERRFPAASWEKGTIVAFFPFVYCKFKLAPSKVVHEGCHLRAQEKMGVEDWWARYFDYPEFRLEEEICAYAEEASFVRSVVRDRNLAFRMIRDMALELSGPLYGNLISYGAALKIIDPPKKSR